MVPKALPVESFMTKILVLAAAAALTLTTPSFAANPCLSPFFDELAKCQAGETMDLILPGEIRYVQNVVDEPIEEIAEHAEEVTTISTHDDPVLDRINVAFEIAAPMADRTIQNFLTKVAAEQSLWWLDDAAFATGESPKGFHLPLQASVDVLQVPPAQ